jgi:hypothetical protein
VFHLFIWLLNRLDVDMEIHMASAQAIEHEFDLTVQSQTPNGDAASWRAAADKGQVSRVRS